jgi:hypothetical protein
MDDNQNLRAEDVLEANMTEAPEDPPTGLAAQLEHLVINDNTPP